MQDAHLFTSLFIDNIIKVASDKAIVMPVVTDEEKAKALVLTQQAWKS
jgi:hypothetical protein